MSEHAPGKAAILRLFQLTLTKRSRPQPLQYINDQRLHERFGTRGQNVVSLSQRSYTETYHHRRLRHHYMRRHHARLL